MALNNVLSVQQLFEGRVFRVPDYQRGYAWETQQRTKFLKDLERLSRKVSPDAPEASVDARS